MVAMRLAQPAWVLVLGLGLSAVGGCTKGGDGTSQSAQPGVKESERLQGAWTVVVAERRGKKAPDEVTKEMRVSVQGDTFSLHDGKQEEKLTFRLDPSKTPRAIDFIPPPGENDKAAQGIYELEGDTWKLCWRKGGERPTEFATSSEPNLVLFVLKRSKQ